MGTSRGGRSRRFWVLTLTLTLAAVIAVMGLAASATAAAGNAACKPIFRTEPCLAPIQTGYAYDGRGGGDLSYIWAKPGPLTVVGEGTTNTPRPGTPYRITKRTFTWHSKENIEIVAVFVVQGLEPHMHYQRLPSGEHGGHATLTSGLIPPRLLLEGRHTA
jgi:hypothetical protein